MGNRAVIVAHDTTKENANKKLGIYVHWHGSEVDIKNVLDSACSKGVRGVDDDTNYFWARFCQLFANYITEAYADYKKTNYETGIGINVVSELDTDNCDNGVYYINNDFEIVKHTNGKELS